MDEYGRAKARIFANQTPADWAVVNADDPATLALARESRSRRLAFSVAGTIEEGVLIRSGAIAEVRGGERVPLVPVASVRLIGRHLLGDVMAAAAVARLAGVSPEAMTSAVESFTGLEHALEPVAEVQGVRFVNDSKATNVEAALRAIESFDAGLVVILGGRYKGGEFGVLAGPLRSRGAAVIAIGEARPLVEKALDGAVPVHRASDMAGAVRQAFTLAPAGGTVLLAPACASFDMFRDYAERGRSFKSEVARLAHESSAAREQ